MNRALNWLIQRIQFADVTNLWLLSGLLLAFIPHLAHLPATLVLFSIFLLGWRLAWNWVTGCYALS